MDGKEVHFPGGDEGGTLSDQIAASGGYHAQPLGQKTKMKPVRIL
jgi:hypothetical protein